MDLYNSRVYMEDVQAVCDFDLDWHRFSGKSLAISGGTGMIGSFLVDVLMNKNQNEALNCTVYVFGRDKEKADLRFSRYVGHRNYKFILQDINQPINSDINNIDYVIHAASNTHPRAYSGDPIGTISANVIGTYNLLEWAESLNCKRFCFLSSVEVYGENKGDTDKFDETYMGYIDCNTLRAGYPESKRTGEALCQAYIRQKNMDIVIPRPARTYGPTMLMSDSKAISQFILKGKNREDIILKSEGTQEYSYSYVADEVSAILYILLYGENGEAYNIASDESDIMLKDLAGIIAEYVGKKVVFELPDEVERAGYSKATKATLDVTKLKKLGWKSQFNMKKGLTHTIDILSDEGC